MHMGALTSLSRIFNEKVMMKTFFIVTDDQIWLWVLRFMWTIGELEVLLMCT